jgi:hypothetical protein
MLAAAQAHSGVNEYLHALGCAESLLKRFSSANVQLRKTLHPGSAQQV